MKSDQPYLAHIAASIAAIESHVAGGWDACRRDRLIQDAVIRIFEVIGEAATHLSPALRATGGVPWGKAIACRNRPIHGYWSIDYLLGPVDKPRPKSNASEQDEAQEAGSCLVVPSGNAPLLLEMTDETLDA